MLITGFPGFLSAHLIQALCAGGRPPERIQLLALPRMRAAAERALDDLPRQVRTRCCIVEGDITKPSLGLTPQALEDALESDTIWHLAALYDLSVSQHAAYSVNVRGTVNVLDFCEQCPDLKRFNYVSTCYVSGDRTGTILESQLDESQGFKNHYEETKFWAEAEVQRRSEALDVVIFRPGIVVGHSVTGETAKYDGPYFLFKLLNQMPDWMPVPRIDSGEVVNLVPIDYAVDAMAYIAAQPTATGRVFQIADPRPMRAPDILALAADELGQKRSSRLTVPLKVLEGALGIAAVERASGMPQQALEYFAHGAVYDTSQTSRALADAPHIRCPHLSTYLGTLLEFMVAHPDRG